MRLLISALIGVSLGGSPFASAKDEGVIRAEQTIKEEKNHKRKSDPEYSTHPGNVDPVVTGGVITPESLVEWEVRSERYKKCPECFETQPYPED